MKPRDIRDLVYFSDDEARHETLFESEHLWSEVICLQGAQGLGPMTDPASDAVLFVLAGEVAMQVGKSRARMKQWESLLVPGGLRADAQERLRRPGGRLVDRGRRRRRRRSPGSRRRAGYRTGPIAMT